MFFNRCCRQHRRAYVICLLLQECKGVFLILQIACKCCDGCREYPLTAQNVSSGFEAETNEQL